MPERRELKLRLDEDRFQRFRKLAFEKNLKHQAALELALDQWIGRTAEAAAGNTITMPSPYAGLNDDQVWTVKNLIEILREQPQGAIFRALDTVLQQAINEYRKTKTAPNAAEKKAANPRAEHDRRGTGTR